jgi:hypothetical protein
MGCVFGHYGIPARGNPQPLGGDIMDSHLTERETLPIAKTPCLAH